MATNTNISIAAATGACNSIVDKIDVGGAGTLRIYAGTQPTGPDNTPDYAGGNTTLAELTLNTPCFGNAADADPNATATADVSPAPADTSANATGTATWFRVFSGGGTAIIDGSVGTASADMVLNTVSIVSGATVSISAWTFTVPEG